MSDASPPPSTAPAADDAARHRELSAEENAAWVRRAKATEAELRERLRAELDASKTAELRVSETWRKVLRLAKVRLPPCCCCCCCCCLLLHSPPPTHTPNSMPHTHPNTHPTRQTTALREDISVAAESFDREVERRDAAVTAALGSLSDIDAQQAHVLANHLRGMERLAQLNDGRLSDLQAEFVRETRAMEAEFAADRGDLSARHAAFRAELLHALQAVKEEEEAKIASDNADFVSARDMLRRQSLEHLHVLQNDMDSRIEASERAFEEAHRAYVDATSQRSDDFKALTERAAAGAAMAERQAAAVTRLQRLITMWRSRTLNGERENRERNEGLQEESTSMSSQVDAMKGEIMKKRRAHMLRLKSLSAAAASVKSRLAEAAGVAEKLLVAADALRCHEPLSDKVDPFRGGGSAEAAAAGAAAAGALRSGSGAAAAAEALGLSPSELAPGAAEVLHEAGALAPFYARFNRALLESLALARRRDRLRAEHADLVDALAQVKDSLRVTPSALDGANGLRVVNGRVAVDAGAGTAGAPSRAAVGASFAATGALQLPVRLGGGGVVPVRPGALGVATVVVEGNKVVGEHRKLGVGGGRR